MLSAENALSRRITTKYQWSPQLKQVVQCLRYWQLWLYQVRNQPVALNQLAHFQEEGAISAGAVFASSLLQQQISTIAGPVDGHPKLVTSFRAELSGIIASLYLIYRVCQFYDVEAGAIKLLCDNKWALTNAFKPIKAGITPYFHTDHDLIELARALIQLIPLIITSEWVKGHYEGKDKQYKHTLNAEANKLAGEFQDQQSPHSTLIKPIVTPNYRIWLLYDTSVITSGISNTLVTSLHDAQLVAHLQRKYGWTSQTFGKIHWDAHERAFRHLPYFYQYSTGKLVHSIVNTNRQNHIFYGQSSLCPICHEAEETLTHVFTYAHPHATDHRLRRFEDLIKTLTMTQTPTTIIDAIRHGFSHWWKDPASFQARSLTAGSLRGPDAVLTAAFHEQGREIGWLHFGLGRISQKWASTARQYDTLPHQPEAELQWAPLLIAALWRYSKSLWTYRNEIVHGATVEEQAQHCLADLRNRIIDYYTEFQNNEHLVLQ
jgi:glutaredoxin